MAQQCVDTAAPAPRRCRRSRAGSAPLPRLKPQPEPRAAPCSPRPRPRCRAPGGCRRAASLTAAATSPASTTVVPRSPSASRPTRGVLPPPWEASQATQSPAARTSAATPATAHQLRAGPGAAPRRRGSRRWSMSADPVRRPGCRDVRDEPGGGGRGTGRQQHQPGQSQQNPVECPVGVAHCPSAPSLMMWTAVRPGGPARTLASSPSTAALIVSPSTGRPDVGRTRTRTDRPDTVVVTCPGASPAVRRARRDTAAAMTSSSTTTALRSLCRACRDRRPPGRAAAEQARPRSAIPAPAAISPAGRVRPAARSSQRPSWPGLASERVLPGAAPGRFRAPARGRPAARTAGRQRGHRGPGRVGFPADEAPDGSLLVHAALLSWWFL